LSVHQAGTAADWKKKAFRFRGKKGEKTRKERRGGKVFRKKGSPLRAVHLKKRAKGHPREKDEGRGRIKERGDIAASFLCEIKENMPERASKWR